MRASARSHHCGELATLLHGGDTSTALSNICTTSSGSRSLTALRTVTYVMTYRPATACTRRPTPGRGPLPGVHLGGCPRSVRALL